MAKIAISNYRAILTSGYVKTLSNRDYFKSFFKVMGEIGEKHREANALLAVDGFRFIKSS